MGDGSTRETTAREATLPRWVRPLVAFHLLAITLWSLPAPAPAIASGALTPSLNTGSLSEFFRSAVPYVHDSILLAAFRVKTPTPASPGPVRTLSSAVHGYLGPTGLWQYWDMFAPNPSSLDVWVDAIVEFEDGSHAVHAYPRMAELSIPEKYVMERFRKYLERAHTEELRFLWPSFAQRMAFEASDDPTNPPVRVTLRRHFRVIPPPGESVPPKYQVFAYYEHVVDREALHGGRASR